MHSFDQQILAALAAGPNSADGLAFALSLELPAEERERGRTIGGHSVRAGLARLLAAGAVTRSWTTKTHTTSSGQTGSSLGWIYRLPGAPTVKAVKAARKEVTRERRA